MDEIAATGFGAAAAAYNEARPGWPEEALDIAFEHFGIDPADGLVVDVAAGTGRLTERLAQRCPYLIAVEPVAEMRAHITQAETRAGTAENLPLDDESAHAIFVGEAFHWFDHPATLAEFARVLRPGGGLAILWNHIIRDPSEYPWQPAIRDLITPHHYHPMGHPLVGKDVSQEDAWQHGSHWAPFEQPLVHHETEHRHPMTRASTLALIQSFSFVGILDPPTKQDLLRRIDAVLQDHGVDRYEQRIRTDVYLTRRR